MSAAEAKPVADPGILHRRLSQYANFSAAELAILDGLAANMEKLPSGSELIAESQPLNRPRVLLAGWGCRFRTLSDGRRQIIEFILPGDFYGLCHRPNATALATAVTLTQAIVADASALGDAIANEPQQYPGLVAACATTASLDENWLLNQLIRVGRQTAYERLAHLFLEIVHRFEAVGLAQSNRVAMPLTQETIADAMGLSVVHLNRTLQQLRRDKLIEFRNGVVKLLQPAKLAVIGDFRVPSVTRQEFVH